MSDDGLAKSKSSGADAFLTAEEKRDTQVTCDVLCSLSSGFSNRSDFDHDHDHDDEESEATDTVHEKRKSKSCPKQHQLPLFLSSKYPDILR